MKCEINSKLAETIRKWASGNMTGLQPSLSYEVNGIDSDVAIKLLVDEFNCWGIDCFILITLKSGKPQVEFVDVSGLKDALQELYEAEMTASVIDPSKVGGCTIDFDNLDDGLCLLVASWGKHETMSTQLNEKHQGGTLFRGN